MWREFCKHIINRYLDERVGEKMLDERNILMREYNNENDERSIIATLKHTRIWRFHRMG